MSKEIKGLQTFDVMGPPVMLLRGAGGEGNEESEDRGKMLSWVREESRVGCFQAPFSEA